MLHKVNLPGCIPQLWKIVDFQRTVLKTACELDYILPLDENQLKAIFGNEIGEWFWEKLWKQPREKDENGNSKPKVKTTIHKNIEKLIPYYQQNPQEGIDALAAFDNDIQFDKNLDNPDFRFQYQNLQKANRDIIKPLMVAFYEDLLNGGFIGAIFHQSKKLNRDNLIEFYWDENPDLKVCSACDRERSEKVDNKVYDDADHFFPKSKYPFLSLHPLNLFPLCIYCNRSFKGDRDIIDDQNNAPLANIFHPFIKTVSEKLDLKVNRDGHGVSRIGEFRDKDGMPSRRMDSLNRVFRLNERWVDRLKTQKSNIIDNLIAERDHLKRRGQDALATIEELREILKYEQTRTLSAYGKRAGFIVQNSYLTCALNDDDEFEELSKYFIHSDNILETQTQ